ncbi:guanylate kinase [Babesia microti strain RI]|uniref:guanylate kinase n=1 Tax=Babesia microti (strain RI) TaxID=1133968 RepID=I7JAD1_BABMR|nr:guanylate kinase [Babesia microti strain RI]CCF73719.1 guanylate kinase [Babesia microti strain RI]|eukprot:XP_012648328.1 guanylate kinase [Babesia microti strain RI]
MLENPSSLAYLPLLIVGPSGVGKGTIIRKLIGTYSSLFSYSISHTTRIPRCNEIHGKHYYFVSNSEFSAIKEAGGFLECVEFCGNNYGTSIAEMNRVRSNKQIPILEIDIAGYVQLLEMNFKMRSIFILPPSLDELRTRLLDRGSDIEETISKRLEIAKNEIEMSEKIFFDSKIVNNSVEKTIQEIDKQLNSWYKDEITKL